MVTNLTFSQALEEAKGGAKIYRDGWNGKGQFLSMAPAAKGVPYTSIWSKHCREFASKQPEGVVNVAPSLTLKNAQGELVMGWVPSTGDLFAEDWVSEN
jgi:hypothetical protein